MKNNFILKQSHLINSILLAVLVFFISQWLLNYYTQGDQVHYIKVYEALSNMALVEAYIYYNLNLDSKEIVHFFLSWLFSSYLSKNLFISIVNGLLAYFTARLLIKWRVSSIIIFFIVILNFYFIVLYTGAERLKFGVLFLVISFYHFDNKKFFVLFSILAVLAHTQLIVIYISIIIYFFIEQIIYTIKFMKIKKFILYLIFLSIIVLGLIYEQLVSKFFAYFDIKSFLELFQWLLLLFLSLIYSRDKTQTLVIFLVLGIITLMVGGTRINMLTYFVFLFYGLQYKQGLNFGVIITSIYFFFKSIPFVYTIYMYGDGFDKTSIF